MQKVIQKFSLFIFCAVALLSAHQNGVTLVDITKINPNIKIDCVYATTRNFTKKQIYLAPKCYLLTSVALQLDKIQRELEKQGLGLLVWDAYRPLSAQQRLWDAFPDPRYVADPKKGGRHSRGTAVDLTIVNLSDGTALEMGTDHDNFTKMAWPSATTISDKAKKNRKLLSALMVKYGFEPLATEWWHFDFHGWQEYPVLKIDFDVIG